MHLGSVTLWTYSILVWCWSVPPNSALTAISLIKLKIPGSANNALAIATLKIYDKVLYASFQPYRRNERSH
jgi:hypothetical protein